MRDWLHVATTRANMPPELSEAYDEGRAAGIEEAAARIETIREERVHEILRDTGLRSPFTTGEPDDDGWAPISEDLSRRYRAAAGLVRKLV